MVTINTWRSNPFYMKTIFKMFCTNEKRKMGPQFPKGLVTNLKKGHWMEFVLISLINQSPTLITLFKNKIVCHSPNIL